MKTRLLNIPDFIYRLHFDLVPQMHKILLRFQRINSSHYILFLVPYVHFGRASSIAGSVTTTKVQLPQSVLTPRTEKLCGLQNS